jgi:hypothetical protein
MCAARTKLNQPAVSTAHQTYIKSSGFQPGVMPTTRPDPEVFVAHLGLAAAHLFVGRYDEASSWAEKALRQRPNAAARHALLRQAMHSPDGWNKRRKRWHACASSFLRCGFPIFGMF